MDYLELWFSEIMQLWFSEIMQLNRQVQKIDRFVRNWCRFVRESKQRLIQGFVQRFCGDCIAVLNAV